MALEFVNPLEEDRLPPTFLVLGLPKVGKTTTLAATLPRPCIIGHDEAQTIEEPLRLARIACPVVYPKSYDEEDNMLNALAKAGDAGFKSIIIDSASGLSDQWGKRLGGKDGLKIQHHGVIERRWKEIVYVAGKSGAIVVITAHVLPIELGDLNNKHTELRIALSGNNKARLPATIAYCLYMTAERRGANVERTIHTSPVGGLAGGANEYVFGDEGHPPDMRYILRQLEVEFDPKKDYEHLKHMRNLNGIRPWGWDGDLEREAPEPTAEPAPAPSKGKGKK